MLHEVKNIERLIKKIKEKSFEPVIKKPLSDLEINFLDEFSNELKKVKKIFDYPDLVYLIFWCRKKKIETLKLKNFNDEKVFPFLIKLHGIIPLSSNVPRLPRSITVLL